MKAKKKKHEKSASKANLSAKPTVKARPALCNDHPQFMEMARTAKKKTLDEPKFGMLFMVNPILAMQEMGAELNDVMVARVKKTIKTSRLSEGDSKLFKKIKQGKTTIPWVDKVTFRKTKIAELIGE